MICFKTNSVRNAIVQGYYVLEDEAGELIESGFMYLRNCCEWCKEYKLHMLIDLSYSFRHQYTGAEAVLRLIAVDGQILVNFRTVIMKHALYAV